MLSDIRVLDLSHLLPGQFATALLAQLGAEVVTVERPGRGDYLRQFPASYGAYNHSKRSVAIDLKREAGVEAFHRLAADADAVVEEFRPGVAKRLGVDYESVAETNPEVVYCSVSGYGQEGPRADHVGHDVNYSSVAGVVDQTGSRDGPPEIPGVPVADMLTAAFAALSVAAGLHGEGGEYVDLSMADVAVNAASVHLAEFFGRGEAPERGETGITGGYPCYAVYECADGAYLSVGAIEPHFWDALCEAVELSEYADEQWPSGERREETFRAFRDRFRERPREEWLAEIDPTTVPVAPVNRIDEVPDDEHVRERDLIREVEGDETTHRVVAYPATFLDHEVTPAPVPLLGEHTRTELEGAGYDDGRIDDLVAEGVCEENP